MIKLFALTFNNFELLDLFGPLEMFGCLKNQISINLISESGKEVQSYQGPTILSDSSLELSPHPDIFLIPGGIGTRKEVDNEELIRYIQKVANKSKYVATICTGTALLAKTNLLNGFNATTNKNAFEWVAGQNNKVNWIRKARWVEDGKYFTSSGVSAGIDMSLALIEKIFGSKVSENVCNHTEYIWNKDKNFDPFYKK